MTCLAARLGPLVAAPTDAELLGQFVAGRDDAAFTELVRRHGPAVLAVCRRLTRHTHDAEDAFQAAFLVLARRAASVRPGDPLGAWLYGVAVRVARRSAERPWRRREASGDVPDVPARTAEPFDPDAARAVVEEVGRLSAACRAAVVLCELEGRSRAAAARELGIAEGTLSSRLAAARKQLAARLSDRGFAPAALAALAGVGVPPALASVTSALATGAPAPAAVAALSRGVLRTMLLHKLRLVPLALAAVAGVALAAGLLAAPPVPDTPPAGVALAVAQPPAAARPAAKGPNRILIKKDRTLVLIDPDGKNETPLATHDPEAGFAFDAKLSPDGKRVAVVRSVASAPGEQVLRRSLFVHAVGTKEEPIDLKIDCETVYWSADGSALVAGRAAGRQGGREGAGFDHRVVDARTGKATRVKLPAEHVVGGWLADGRFVTTELSFTTTVPKGRVYLMNRDGTESKAVTDGTAVVAGGATSPDGTRLLGLRPFFKVAGGKDESERDDLVVIDVATGRVTPVANIPPNGDLQGMCWSPDGTKLAYTWRQLHPGTDDERARMETESRLVVADADGRNTRTVLTAKGPGQWIFTLGAPDWR
ncbi:MAG TPA: sigma-70 family RNA polymerase sigma factor [Urbifossiella sp.]|nr:sigma-70 family RNA polymerase sigma factor [Urbifossiella sp.]